MTTNTPNLNLITYNDEEDLQRTFQQFLDDLTGITNSNMTKIDDWGGDIEEELDDKSPLDSPNFTGIPTAPTAEVGTDTNQIATTAFVLANSRGNSTLDWRTGTGTWSYVSADSPSFVISIPDNDAESISLGYKIKLTQTTDKYFIVTLIGTSIAGYTPITVYGGTDYTLENTTITNPLYSSSKSPIGFPLLPDKWSVSFSNNTDQSQANVPQNDWVNIGTSLLSIPVGAWWVDYSAFARSSGGIGGKRVLVTLSTANNSQSDLNNTFLTVDAPGEMVMGISNISIALTSKATYYLNCSSSINLATLQYTGTRYPTRIIARTQYL